MKKILVIGSLNMDIVVTVDQMPQTGETVIGKGLRYSPGGKGANQAFAAGRLGGEVVMLGYVGNDTFGKELVNNLSVAGVDTSHIVTSAKEPTGTAVIYVDDKGDNSIVVISGANGECDEAYLKSKDDIFQQCEYVLLQMEIPQPAVWYAIKRAHELGKTVILNPAPAPNLLPPEILGQVNYITPNETELAKISGKNCDNIQNVEDAARDLASKTNVLVTVGKRGAVLAEGGRCEVYPTIKMKPIDTTAAGDCFNAAFVTSLSQGKTPQQAIAYANVAAGLAVSKKGAQSSIPTKDEVESLMSKGLIYED